MTGIILDCDPGHDDAIALMLALGSPEVELLGVTTASGNQTVAKTTANAIRVLDHLGREDISVAAGAKRPLVRDRHVAADVHGETGLDGPAFGEPAVQVETIGAIEFMRRVIMEPDRQVTLVATGPLTNVAGLMLAHPEAAERLRAGTAGDRPGRDRHGTAGFFL